MYKSAMIEFDGPKVFNKPSLSKISLPQVEAKDLQLAGLELPPPAVLSGEKSMMGTKQEEKNTNPLADFINEMFQGAAAVVGAVTGLTAKESKSFFDSKSQEQALSKKETETQALKVAMARDLEEMSRQQSEVSALESSKTAQKQQVRLKNEAKKE
ncbi:MAG: hypothetical protein IT292_05915 [Deltaproteobacteria bacterium]|nr:hypothetical protein [Deltaproteobacteria bacterium]